MTDQRTNSSALRTGFIVVMLIATACSGAGGDHLTAEQVRELANAFYNRGLYDQAIEAYTDYLGYARLDPASRANLYYAVAEIYFERQADYAAAMSWYMRIKHLTPESPLVDEANKKIVACLERLDRPADASQALKEAAALEPEQAAENRPGDVLAKIGDRTITTGDLDHLIRKQMAQLPPEMQPKEITREDKINLLKQYVLMELLYNTAKRRNLDQDKQIIADMFEVKKMMMANRVQQEEIKDKVQVSAADVELYYEKHKQDFAEKDEAGKVKRERPLQEVRDAVARAVQMQKTQTAISELLDRLVVAEDVALFEDKVK